MTDTATYLAAIEGWRTKRLAALKASDGWLNLVSRDWLSPGVFSVGRAGDNLVGGWSRRKTWATRMSSSSVG